MAGLKDGDNYKDGEFLKSPTLLKLICLAVGVGGLVLFFALRYLMPEKAGEMGYSWLFAVVFFLTLSIGGMFWTLLHHASNSGWGTVIRRLMENLGVMVLVCLVLGLPLLVPQMGFRDALWEWFPKRAAALEVATEKAEKGKSEYVAKHDASVGKVTAELEEAKTAFAAIDSPSPGHRAHFERKISSLESKVEDLSSAEVTEETAKKKLTDKFFLKEEALLYVKRAYLNENMWYLRFWCYFIALVGIAYTLKRWSVRQDSDANPKWFRWMRRWSCGFLPFFATAWTFLVFDWLMALDYAWFSTMWGVYLFAGCALNSMGLLVIMVTILRKAGYLKNVVTLEHYHLMGKLMLAFVIFWAYIAFSQFFLIWYANITEETKFYLTRNTDFWNTFTIVLLVIGHFFIPFAILLIQKVKTMPLVLSGIAVWNLIMHFCDIYWIIIPERGISLSAAAGGEIQMTIPGAWMFDVLAFVSVAGIFGFFLLRQLGSASLFPCRDPRLDESLNVVN
ncbi:MAG: hypothetical protein P1U58_02445 [Verrucomicrobiales bacterium]|nr:hypothetical protein [Verrucomicrobiales bacterium]